MLLMSYTNPQEESSPHCFDSFIFKTFVKSWAKPLGHWEYSVNPQLGLEWTCGSLDTMPETERILLARIILTSPWPFL